MSDNIAVKIYFLDSARPYIPYDEYSNIVLSVPRGALPNTGDVIQLEGITHPKGAFLVSHRVFSFASGHLDEISLAIGVEGAEC